ncbi:MAG: fumarylacetoacetate hydrolase family protein [Acidobacteriota bacterium]|nr:fumarylacetoacetate hydrolase family protein [Acidobacteriota bacterium]
MKFCRFVPSAAVPLKPGFAHFGLIEGQQIREISVAPWAEWSQGTRMWRVDDVRLLPPVEPGKIVCIGRNYAAHAAELGHDIPEEPLMFLKATSSLIGPEDSIVLTRYSQRVDHEGELAVIIGKTCSQLHDADDPLEYILGYSCLNDVTARDLQKKDVQFTRAKSFDTFCPVGPHIETDINPADVLVETRVNGDVRQSASTSLMLYPVAYLVRWISRMMTLHPGDVIATGTPAGVGPLAPGDTVEVKIASIGVLRNPVHAPQP